MPTKLCTNGSARGRIDYPGYCRDQPGKLRYRVAGSVEDFGKVVFIGVTHGNFAFADADAFPLNGGNFGAATRKGLWVRMKEGGSFSSMAFWLRGVTTGL